MENNTAADGSNPTPAMEEKTFSQEQLNQIVIDRLAREKSKYEAATAEKEAELARRELMLSAREKLAEKGLPPTLCEAINTSSPEALERSVEIIEEEINRVRALKQNRLVGMVPGESRERFTRGNTDSAIRTGMGL